MISVPCVNNEIRRRLKAKLVAVRSIITFSFAYRMCAAESMAVPSMEAGSNLEEVLCSFHRQMRLRAGDMVASS